MLFVSQQILGYRHLKGLVRLKIYCTAIALLLLMAKQLRLKGSFHQVIKKCLKYKQIVVILLKLVKIIPC